MGGRKRRAEADESEDHREVIHREVVPLAAEVPRVDTRTIVTGRVRVTTHTRSRQEAFDVDLTEEDLEIERVRVGREVDGPVEIRQEGDVTIVPVLEEVLVVRKQLVLKEEVRIRRRRQRRKETRSMNLLYQVAEIDRSSEDEEVAPSGDGENRRD
ncbi:MAG TPA: DUF2382 domain-containing protein [Trueperaceae bacterium]